MGVGTTRMTTIAYRDGVLAADTRVVVDGRIARCTKLHRVLQGRRELVVGLAGDSFAGLEFLEWLKSGGATPSARLLDGEGEFHALVLTRRGLFDYDRWCRPERVQDRYYAVGSGAAAALGAMHAGLSAAAAVKTACQIDPYSGLPVETMKLEGKARARPRVA